ncbi:HET-domain-containing protein [Phaeosphaeriaceae sp. SRC1lsM3a]|nr:HET-domain-containing protein [Stagonospora sp. SRC1lsM3a]
METHAQYPATYLETSESDEFIYEPLANVSTDFRLLQVLPDQRNGRTQIELWNVSSSRTENASVDYPAYQCLSYTWGAPDEGHEIYLNGCLFHVRRNLSDFLHQAAQSLQMQPLWIDALCINQHDIKEKNLQVTRMGLIYNRARRVLVWLGIDASLIPLARYMARDCPPEYLQEIRLADREASFAAFWSHPYWTRTWITQELLMAASRQMLIDRYAFDWTCIDSILTPAFLLTHKLPKIANFERNQNFYTLDWIRQDRPILNDRDFWEVLHWRYDSACSITSDRIYALLSLSHGGASFCVSYEEGPAHLFWRVGHHFQAWSSVWRMQELRIALRLTRHDIVRSMRPTGSLVLELRVARGDAPRCSQCGMDVVPGHLSNILMCSNLSGVWTANPLYRHTHVLLQRRSKARPITTKLKTRQVYDYTLKVVYDDSANETKVDLSHRALTYRVGDNWVTSTPELLDVVRRGGMEKKGSGLVRQDAQACPERWAVFLPPGNVLYRLDELEALRLGARYPWWEERWDE